MGLGATRESKVVARGARAMGVAFAASVVLFVRAVVSEPSAAPDGPPSWLAWQVDALAGVLLVLVTGVSAVALAYADRYLRGDPARDRFAVLTVALAGATAALVTAATLVALAVAWILAGVAVVALLALRRDDPVAADGARRARRAFLVGDGALVAAVVAVSVVVGPVDLRRPDAALEQLAASPWWVWLGAFGVVAAALARSAQLPLPSWLPRTLAAPTPVSALLHAGVVNAGGILLVRAAPLVGASRPAMVAVTLAGAATTLYGTALLLTAPDIKGALARSTVAQMGFMVTTCGVGLYAAAVVHLVAHGMFKAALFLGSGRAVHAHVAHRRAPAPPVRPPAQRRLAVVVAAVVPAGALAVAAPSLGGGLLPVPLLVFAWATGAVALRGWLRRRPDARGVAVGVVTAVSLSFAYVAVVHAVESAVLPSVDAAAATGPSPWWLLALLGALVGLASLRHARSGPVAALARRLYAAALTASVAPRVAVRPPGPAVVPRRAAVPGRHRVPRAARAPGGAPGLGGTVGSRPPLLAEPALRPLRTPEPTR